MSKISRLSKQKSVMNIEANPLESGAVTNAPTMKLENLSECVPISPQQLADFIKRLQAVDSNEERLRIMEEVKVSYLFTSENLLKILEVTTSLKTRIHMIGHIGPRLTDPKAKTEQFLGMFRYSDEKNQVEEILKARAQAIQSAMFSTAGGPAIGGGGGRGLGGRGGLIGGRGAGRGRGAAAPLATNTNTNNANTSGGTSPKRNNLTSSEPSSQTPSNRSSMTVETTQNAPETVETIATLTSTPDIKSNVSTPLNTPEGRISGLDEVFDFLDANGSRSARSSRRVPNMQTISEDQDDDDDDDDNDNDNENRVVKPETIKEGPETDDSEHDDTKMIPTGITTTETSSPATALTLLAMDSPLVEKETLVTTPSLKMVKVTKGDSTTMTLETRPSPLEVSQEQLLQEQNEANVSSTSSIAKALFSPVVQEKEEEEKAVAEPPIDEEKDDNTSYHNSNRDSAAYTISSDRTPININAMNTHSLNKKEENPVVREKNEKRLDSFYDVDATVDDDDDNENDNNRATINNNDNLSTITEEKSISLTSKQLTINANNNNNDDDDDDDDDHNGNGVTPPSTTSSLTTTTQRSVSKRYSTGMTNAASFTAGSTSQPIVPSIEPTRQSSFTNANKPMGRRHSEFSMVTAQQHAIKLSTFTSNISTGGLLTTGGDDLALRYANLLNMSKNDFMALEKEEPIRIVDERPQFTYRELLRIVYRKDYGQLKQNELESYLCDEEFIHVFNKNKGEFAAQAKWRQVEQKKKACLF